MSISQQLDSMQHGKKCLETKGEGQNSGVYPPDCGAIGWHVGLLCSFLLCLLLHLLPKILCQIAPAM